MSLCVSVYMSSLLTSDSRASSLLRSSASRKMATDRDMNMTLWKNYVVMCCCIAPPSHTATVVTSDYRCVTPELTAVLVSLSLCLSVCLSVCRSVGRSVGLSVSVSVSVSVSLCFLQQDSRIVVICLCTLVVLLSKKDNRTWWDIVKEDI